jgi:hypothetical protein
MGLPGQSQAEHRPCEEQEFAGCAAIVLVQALDGLAGGLATVGFAAAAVAFTREAGRRPALSTSSPHPERDAGPARAALTLWGQQYVRRY